VFIGYEWVGASEALDSILEADQKLRHPEAKCFGKHRQDLDGQVASAILRRADVRPVDAAAIREFFL
jgi:hypothetical protein